MSIEPTIAEDTTPPKDYEPLDDSNRAPIRWLTYPRRPEPELTMPVGPNTLGEYLYPVARRPCPGDVTKAGKPTRRHRWQVGYSYLPPPDSI